VDTITAGGASVNVRRWGGRERWAFDGEVARQKAGTTRENVPVDCMLPFVFALSAVNEDLSPMFTIDEVGAIEQGVSGDLLLAVFDWAVTANGLLKQGQEEARKN
jgi:hypothetical protein